ncbi:MAG: hypothetical protein J6T74_09235 [Clostridia bacterium]|nr:hypothetical protein [Clostridia bacterium]
MYDLIYGYIHDYLFASIELENYSMFIMGVNTDLSVWLAHTCTIIAMVLIFTFLIIFIKWLFKLVSGLFLLK